MTIYATFQSTKDKRPNVVNEIFAELPTQPKCNVKTLTKWLIKTLLEIGTFWNVYHSIQDKGAGRSIKHSII